MQNASFNPIEEPYLFVPDLDLEDRSRHFSQIVNQNHSINETPSIPFPERKFKRTFQIFSEASQFSPNLEPPSSKNSKRFKEHLKIRCSNIFKKFKDQIEKFLTLGKHFKKLKEDTKTQYPLSSIAGMTGLDSKKIQKTFQLLNVNPNNLNPLGKNIKTLLKTDFANQNPIPKEKLILQQKIRRFEEKQKNTYFRKITRLFQKAHKLNSEDQTFKEICLDMEQNIFPEISREKPIYSMLDNLNEMLSNIQVYLDITRLDGTFDLSKKEEKILFQIKQAIENLKTSYLQHLFYSYTNSLRWKFITSKNFLLKLLPSIILILPSFFALAYLFYSHLKISGLKFLIKSPKLSTILEIITSVSAFFGLYKTIITIIAFEKALQEEKIKQGTIFAYRPSTSEDDEPPPFLAFNQLLPMANSSDTTELDLLDSDLLLPRAEDSSSTSEEEAPSLLLEQQQSSIIFEELSENEPSSTSESDDSSGPL